MLITGHTERPEGPEPTQEELVKVWNFIWEYQRSPSNNSKSLPAALREVRGCSRATMPCDHDWDWVDESFDHEFGTEQAGHYECTTCGEARDGDYESEHFDDDVL